MSAKPAVRLLRTAALAIVSWVVAVTIGRHIDPHSAFLEFSILNGLASFLALYAGLGRGAPAARAITLLAGLSIVVAWEASFGEWPEYYPPLVAAGSNLAATLAACLAARAFGGEFARGAWSIRSLMATTAAVGVLFACLGGLRADSSAIRLHDLANWGLQGLVLALIAIASALPLRGRRPWLVLIAVPCAVAIAITSCYFADYWATGNWRHSASNLRWHAALALVHAIAIGGPLWALGMRGPGVATAGDRPERDRQPSLPESDVIVSSSSPAETTPRPEPTLHQLARALLVDPAAWFATPNPQFGARKPGDLLGTDEEQKVYNLLAALDQGLF